MRRIHGIALVLLLAAAAPARAGEHKGPDDGLVAVGFSMDGALGNYPLVFMAGRFHLVRANGLFVDAAAGWALGTNKNLYSGVQVDGVVGWSLKLGDSSQEVKVTVDEEHSRNVVARSTSSTYRYYETTADAIWQVVPIVGTRTLFGGTIVGKDGNDLEGVYFRAGAGVQIHRFFREYFPRGDHERFGFSGLRLMATFSPHDGYDTSSHALRSKVGVLGEYWKPTGLGQRQGFMRVFGGVEPSLGMFLGLGIGVPLWVR